MKEGPFVAVELVVSSEDEDIFSLRADSDLRAVLVVREAVNTGVDAVILGHGLWWHICFNVL